MNDLNCLGLQPVSHHMLKTKYLRQDMKTSSELFTFIADAAVEEMKKKHFKDPSHNIIAKNIENLDFSYPSSKEDISNLLEYFQPGGRIISNMGRDILRTCLVNCTGLDVIEDSMEGILSAQNNYVRLLQSGTGVGINFSSLRPSGSYVHGVDGVSSGPVSFMRTFDAWSKTVESAGSRRGASIAVLDVSHPDIQEFIRCKEQRGTLTQFNISVGMTEEFMQAFEQGQEFTLNFRGKPYKKVPAVEIFDEIIKHTYDHSEPGILFLDIANKYNPLYKQEVITLSNPCGEIVGTYNLSCILGSMLLHKFVRDPFGDNPSFDFYGLMHYSFQAQCFLDLIIEMNNLPVQANIDELMKKRKRGLGFTALSDAMIMQRMRYGSKESIEFTKKVQWAISAGSLLANFYLATILGPCPALSDESDIADWLSSPFYKEKILPLTHDKLIIEDFGAKASDKFEEIFSWIFTMQKEVLSNGFRFTHGTAVAPTATISMINNNLSSGIEPVFSFKGYRNIIVGDSRIKDQVVYYDYAFLMYIFKRLEKLGEAPKSIEELITACNAFMDSGECLPDYFVTSTDVSIDEHLNVLAACSNILDQSCSKTINVPAEASFEDFKDVYHKAHKLGIKGVTTYRPNPQKITSVLVNAQVQKSTLYEFTLADGSVHRVSGDTMLKLPGEEKAHVASNVYDSIVDPAQNVVRKANSK